MPTQDDIQNAAYWLRAAADYITGLHERLGIKSTSYADSLRIEASALDGHLDPAVTERLQAALDDWTDGTGQVAADHMGRILG